MMPRSVLYVPAHRPPMLDKLATIPADFFVVDLEDGVAPAEKQAARKHLRDASASAAWPEGRWALRVNAVGSPWMDADLQVAADISAPFVVLPKAEDPDLVRRIAQDQAKRGGQTMLMIETALGVGRARELAGAHSSIRALLYGSADLRLSLGAKPDDDRCWEQHAMSEILLAARMSGAAAIDAVTFQFQDQARLERDARMARELGFDGKSAIHPAQVETIHRVFSSTSDEIAWAERVQHAWRAGDGDRSGVVVMDGEMIEALHLEVARKILDRG